MRVFFAIELVEETKAGLYSIQQNIKKMCSGGNFTHKENFHLTLRFIGEQSSSQVNELKNILKLAAKETAAFELRMSNIGTFNKGNKKIIWAGIDKSSKLQGLFERLEARLEATGYPREERSYSPHITLVREAKPLEAFQFGSINFDMLTIKVSSISLMESTRIDNKLTYRAVDRAELL